MDYPCKPNICNLDGHMERSGRGSLWPCEMDDPGLLSPKAKKPKVTSPISKDTPLYRLHWVTLGYHYNWTTKEYSSDRRSPFPPDLSELSTFILHHAGFPGYGQPTPPQGLHFEYQFSGSSLKLPSSTTITWTLLSLDTQIILKKISLGHYFLSGTTKKINPLNLFCFHSFGQSAIFLIGGSSKEIKPTPMLLQSGDVIIMSKEARLAYHGVPRIVAPLEEKGGEVPACLTTEAIMHGLCGCGVEQEGDSNPGDCLNCQELVSAWDTVLPYLSVSRINVNVRQVASKEYHF